MKITPKISSNAMSISICNLRSKHSSSSKPAHELGGARLPAALFDRQIIDHCLVAGSLPRDTERVAQIPTREDEPAQHDGAVVLRGFVFSGWDLRHALSIARKTAGDKTVVDNLSIKEGGR